MKPITLAALKRVSEASIRRAGPRYTPAIDPNAPNLEITQLVNAIETLSQSAVYKKQLDDLETELRSAWNKASAEIRGLFDKKVSASALYANLIQQLRLEKPGLSIAILRQIRRAPETIETRLRPYEHDLYEQRIQKDKSPEEQSKLAARVHSLQEFQQAVTKLRDFTTSPNFALVQNNRLFLKGGWGSGKTHLLCDVVRARADRSLPSLLLLAQVFPRSIDPLVGACRVSGLARTPRGLLRELDRLGKGSGSRALLVIDGINEGDRVAWHRHMPWIVKLLRQYPNVALILSCRTPFHSRILTSRTSAAFVQITHNGFEEIEFDAQREFFRYYKIPTPHIPLLAPEFSRPLFLKIFCQTIASLSGGAKNKRLNDFAAGHKGMTKLLEDFVVQVGNKIEADFKLPPKTCWRLLKGQGEGPAAVGLAVQMAEQGRDYVDRQECIEIVRKITALGSTDQIEEFLSRMISDGLLAEDGVYEESDWKEVIRLPYQRFSDHLISRHLLGRYLKTESETGRPQVLLQQSALGQNFQS